jgi:hypothetical protein
MPTMPQGGQEGRSAAGVVVMLHPDADLTTPAGGGNIILATRPVVYIAVGFEPSPCMRGQRLEAV